MSLGVSSSSRNPSDSIIQAALWNFGNFIFTISCSLKTTVSLWSIWMIVFHFTHFCLSSCFCSHELKDSGPVVLESEALEAIDTAFRREGERSRRKERKREEESWTERNQELQLLFFQSVQNIPKSCLICRYLTRSHYILTNSSRLTHISFLLIFTQEC